MEAKQFEFLSAENRQLRAAVEQLSRENNSLKKSVNELNCLLTRIRSQKLSGDLDRSDLFDSFGLLNRAPLPVSLPADASPRLTALQSDFESKVFTVSVTLTLL